MHDKIIRSTSNINTYSASVKTFNSFIYSSCRNHEVIMSPNVKILRFKGFYRDVPNIECIRATKTL